MFLELPDSLKVLVLVTAMQERESLMSKISEQESLCDSVLSSAKLQKMWELHSIHAQMRYLSLEQCAKLYFVLEKYLQM